MTQWTYKNEPVTSPPVDAFGFVYLITSLIDGRKYIGRKYLTKSAKKSVKLKNGTRKVRKTRAESDWAKYTGSCKPLLEDIAKSGRENYTFEILAWGFTKGQVNTLEVWTQIKYGVMIDPLFYNDAIGSGQFRGVKWTDEFKNILKNI